MSGASNRQVGRVQYSIRMIRVFRPQMNNFAETQLPYLDFNPIRISNGLKPLLMISSGLNFGFYKEHNATTHLCRFNIWPFFEYFIYIAAKNCKRNENWMMKNRSDPRLLISLPWYVSSQNMSHPCSQRLVKLMQCRLHDFVSVTMIHTDSQFT